MIWQFFSSLRRLLRFIFVKLLLWFTLQLWLCVAWANARCCVVFFFFGPIVGRQFQRKREKRLLLPCFASISFIMLFRISWNAATIQPARSSVDSQKNNWKVTKLFSSLRVPFCLLDRRRRADISLFLLPVTLWHIILLLTSFFFFDRFSLFYKF